MTKRLLIVRHAERPIIPPDQVGNELSLTEDGVRATKQFASALEGNVVSIHCSPILRCVQTARLIADEHGYSHSEIQHSHLLGDPGFFIDDGDLAWKNWLNRGSNAVNAHLLSGTETWPGFHPFQQAVDNMLAHIRNALFDCRSGLIVWVTHDTILATLASRILEKSLTMDDWPNYLGHLDISVNEGGKLISAYSKN